MTRVAGWIGFAFAVLAGGTGCNRAVAAEILGKADDGAATPSASAPPGASGNAAPASADGHSVTGGAPKYAVPFAWESSPSDPLSVARAFLGEALRDNRVHASQGTKAFLEYREAQHPRATVLTCSDSRVHTPAFDSTPENDVFMIRNIGNQLGNAQGSVEYAVEHLETPVLLVIGHTGCGAVKAAMGDLSKQSKAVRAELDAMVLPKPAAGVDENGAWSEAVIANVHSQVRRSVSRFGQRVQQGKLTVVGAVYDFRNDLGHGAGKLDIIDVNGNDEAERMKAFVEAISAPASPSSPGPRSGSAPRPPVTGSPQAWSPKDLERALQELDAKQSVKARR
jgi:carbonic anhydrase